MSEQKQMHQWFIWKRESTNWFSENWCRRVNTILNIDIQSTAKFMHTNETFPYLYGFALFTLDFLHVNYAIFFGGNYVNGGNLALISISNRIQWQSHVIGTNNHSYANLQRQNTTTMSLLVEKHEKSALFRPAIIDGTFVHYRQLILCHSILFHFISL